MNRFAEALAEINPSKEGRSWVYVPYDQITDDFGPLAEREPSETGVVLVESSWKAARRPYHRQKLALVLANQRQFALEQARRGVAVRHVATERPFGDALESVADELGGLTMMEPAERELAEDLAPLVAEGLIETVPHRGWITTREQFDEAAEDGPPWRMDAFYRRVRRDTGYLMEDGKPVGGKYSFDADNRETWDGDPAAPEPPRFEPDEVTREVGELIEERFERHPGRLDLTALPATRDDAERLWKWAKAECLEAFGPYEDAMSTRSRGLFHTRISPLLNICRLTPTRVVEEALATEAPLSSREGFLRQLAGWREFMRHVHRATDGFRDLDGVGAAATPGDGGWSRYRGEPWADDTRVDGPDGGATPSVLDADQPLPAAFWGVSSGLACLDTVVADVWHEAYSHHITRLMVLANLGTLLGVEPRQLADWFWAAYADAYDWVVEPNVLAMGTFATGELMTTKPYVSGAAYINRMSDYCADCRFDPKKNCPITSLYWAFLDRNQERLDGNRRMNLPLASLRKRGDEKRERDRRVARKVAERLAAGEELAVDDFN